MDIPARLGCDQHAGLEMDDHLHACRNVESRFYNLVTGNLLSACWRQCRFDLDRHHPLPAPHHEVDLGTAL